MFLKDSQKMKFRTTCSLSNEDKRWLHDSLQKAVNREMAVQRKMADLKASIDQIYARKEQELIQRAEEQKLRIDRSHEHKMKIVDLEVAWYAQSLDEYCRELLGDPAAEWSENLNMEISDSLEFENLKTLESTFHSESEPHSFEEQNIMLVFMLYHGLGMAACVYLALKGVFG
jgi:hypothetical protein